MTATVVALVGGGAGLAARPDRQGRREQPTCLTASGSAAADIWLDAQGFRPYRQVSRSRLSVAIGVVSILAVITTIRASRAAVSQVCRAVDSASVGHVERSLRPTPHAQLAQ